MLYKLNNNVFTTTCIPQVLYLPNLNTHVDGSLNSSKGCTHSVFMFDLSGAQDFKVIADGSGSIYISAMINLL